MTTLDIWARAYHVRKFEPALYRPRCYATRTLGSTRWDSGMTNSCHIKGGYGWWSLRAWSCFVTSLEIFFLTRAPAFLFRTAAGGRCLPAVEENATNERPRRNEVCLVMAVNDGGVPPILAQKHDRQRSAFTSENLLREARRQKRITDSSIPNICVF